MANITRANGTLTLAGNWDADDIALFQPVLRSWSFYGQYGIQHCDKLSEQKKSASFYGCGRWGFSGTLESFHAWTLDWIKNHGPLTEQQYQEFLEQLEYYTITSNPVDIPWEEYGKECFDAAADFFRSFTVDADDLKLKKWVKQWIRPSHCYLQYTPQADVYDFLEDNMFMMGNAFFYDEVLFDALQLNIKLKEDARLEEMYRFLDETYGIDCKMELPENYDRSYLEEQESDEAFIGWYERLEER